MKRYASSFRSGVLRGFGFLAVSALSGSILTPSPLFAQDFRSTLTGQVTDPSGSVLPNVKITVTNNSSQTVYSGTTTDKGTFFIPYVLPGVYTVTAELQGFKTAVQDKVLLQTSTTFNQNFKLEVGGVEQKVVVSDAPPLLETTTGSGGTVIDSREIQNVPLNGGQSYMLIGTTTGSQFTTTGFGPGVGNSGTRGWDVTNSYTVGGGVVGNNQFTLNGTNITSQTGYGNHSPGEWTVSPNIDSIQEVNVMTQTYDARYGRTSGGTINVSTKSGGEHYHGDAHYGYEGTFMNADTYQNNLQGLPRNGEVENHFWITAGGPIIKKRLFGFFGFEGYRQALASITTVNVPPAYLRPGYNGNPGVDFSLIKTMDPQGFTDSNNNPVGLPIFQPGTATCLDGGAVTACNSNHVVQQQFPGNAIPAAQINGTALAVLKYVPLPNIPGAENSSRGANYAGHTPDLYDYNQPQIRVDYNLTDKTKLYSYFLYWKGTENRSGNSLNGIASNGNINWAHQNWVATQDLTHVFSPSLIGDFKISFNRFLNTSPDGDLSQQTDPSSIGLAMPLPGTTKSRYLPEFTVGDSWGTGLVSGKAVFGNQSNLDVTNGFTFDADLTKTAGAHTLEFGGEFDEFQYGNPGSIGSANGAFGFDATWTGLNPHSGGCYPITPGSGSSAGNSNVCGSNTPNGSALASFYLGTPASGGIDWNKTIFEGQPVYAIYVQDNWRATHRLTLNIGLRYDVQRGLRERNNELNRGLCLTCVNPLTNDALYQSNVANGSNQAAWIAAGINPASLQQVLGGVEFAGVNGNSRDAYDTDWSNVGPRFGFAFAIDPKTVVRGGYGVMYSFGLEGGSSIGQTQHTNYTASTDGSNTPTNNFQTGNPFATGLLQPVGNTMGLLTDIGNGTIQSDFPNRKIPREQLVSLGIQRELPAGFVLDAKYAGNFSSRLRINIWQNGTATLAMQKAAYANPQVWAQQVPNPYYGVAGMSGPGQCGTSTTVQAIALLLPGSQYCSPGGYGLIGQYNSPQGRNWYDGLEVKLTRKITSASGKGLSMQLAYTYSKTINGDGYQNGWPYQDPFQVHWLAGTDRTHVLSVTSVWDLPIGRGGLFFTHPNAIAGVLVNDWVLSGVFNAQSGLPVGINTGEYYTCPGTSYRSPKGQSVRQGTWFNDDQSCWSGITQWGLSNLSNETAQVRQPTAPSLDLSVQKGVPIHNNWLFSLRLDAYNALNTVQFPGPDTNPGDGAAEFVPGSGWRGFGTVALVQQNFPRVLQIEGKVSF